MHVEDESRCKKCQAIQVGEPCSQDIESHGGGDQFPSVRVSMDVKMMTNNIDIRYATHGFTVWGNANL